MKTVHTPNGQIYTLYKDMLQQTHLLIAGTTGSGKSVVINGIIHTALYQSPNTVKFIMIDLKKVELYDYKQLPHTLTYADTIETTLSALNYALNIIESRYKIMQQKHLKKCQDAHIYVIIDELADLMTVNKRQILPLIQRIAQIGRAANVHIIAATQCPLATVIPTAIKVNFDSRVALRTRSSQDSRNILGVSGCELLPQYGEGYYMTPTNGIVRYHIPMITNQEHTRIINHWKNEMKPSFLRKITALLNNNPAA